jgi:glycosyltransferase involved in cell wall biosynthesis
MTAAYNPRVSIGLPVYNGENYLAIAIESILGQTFTDFELIVCDNASTDRTEEIGRYFAAQDARVKFVRNPVNLGAGPNFDKVLELGSGEYFKWAAHDDVLTPTFLEKCVSALDQNPDAVLCQSLVALIDSFSNVTDIYDPNLTGTWSTRASDRFASIILQPHLATDCFGLIRRTALEGAPLMSAYLHGDTVLLAFLALRGRFIQVREPLFQNRSHPQRFSEGVSYHERAAWWGIRDKGQNRYPLRSLYGGCGREMRRQDLDLGNRLRCYLHLAHWWLVDWNGLRIAIEMISRRYPPAYSFARRVKYRVLGRKNLGFDWTRWSIDRPKAGR